MKKITIALIAIVVVALIATVLLLNTQTQKEPEHFTNTTGVATFFYEPLNTEINVFYHIPEGGKKSTMPILFSIHGTVRNADDYRDFWIEQSNSKNFMVFAPEFRNEGLFAGADGYNLGRMFDGTELRPKEEWTFSVIEALFDFIVKDLGSKRTKYDMWGHSAGAQFIHRYLYFIPNARVDRAVAANAGWYTLPDFAIEYPFGLRNTPATVETREKAFARKLYIALGTEDNDHTASDLRRCPNTDKQGIHRFDRGHFFWDNAQINNIGTEFNWKKVIVPGVAHSGRRMAQETGYLLYN